MVNNNSKVNFEEMIISSLAVLKVESILSENPGEKYEELKKMLSEEGLYSEIIEDLSEIAAMQLYDLIELEAGRGKGAKLILNPKNSDGEFICDAVVLSSDNIQVMKIVSMEYDFIDAKYSVDIIKSGCQALDKYLCETNCKTIDLIVIQPNFLAASRCRVPVSDLLDSYDKQEV